MAEGRQWREGPVEVVGLESRAGSGEKECSGDYRGATFIRAQLQATGMNAEGSSLKVFIEDTLDGGANWNPVGEFPELVSDGGRMDERLVIDVTGPFTDTLRVRWEMAARDDVPPTFNFGVRWYVE